MNLSEKVGQFNCACGKIYEISGQDINDKRAIDCECGTKYIIKPSNGGIVAEIQNIDHLKKK